VLLRGTVSYDRDWAKIHSAYFLDTAGVSDEDFLVKSCGEENVFMVGRRANEAVEDDGKA
jgi:hypothetical protein